MVFRRFKLASATFLLLGLVLWSGCDKGRKDTTAPMGPGAEQGGAGSDGTNSVTNAEGGPGDANTGAGAGSDAASDADAAGGDASATT